ncbi:MAG: poly(3-hydroxybutyrate) depolymerase [Verrucomicrobiales bacterium]|nr:poly(3-hydroxybutyrate) depolymerase [Verrucomicrobiales bacterium]
MRMRIYVLLLAMIPMIGEAAPKLWRQIETRHYQFEEAKKKMVYTVFVPSGYDRSKAAPLLVLLHGLFSDPHQVIRYGGLLEEAEKHGVVVACPMGYDRVSWYGSRGPGKMGIGGPRNQGALSEKDVMNVLTIVRKDFNVDPKRIYLGGHSMGGAGTFHLGAKHPELWAGLAPIAPAMFGLKRDLNKIKDLPVILVQGEKDMLCMAIFARGCVRRMKALKMDHLYVEEKGGGHIDVAMRHWPEIFDFLLKRPRL